MWVRRDSQGMAPRPAAPGLAEKPVATLPSALSDVLYRVKSKDSEGHPSLNPTLG